MFPRTRMRRLRKSEKLRELVREVRVTKNDLVYPIFVHEKKRREEIPSMPKQFRYPVSEVANVALDVADKGINAVLLFGIPEKKDEIAKEAYNPEGVVQKALREIKHEVDILVITDVCLCQYMANGHCGIVKNQEIANDESLELLAKTALSHAEAGADLVAPSDMMDGRVLKIRETLDEEGFQNVGIMSYAAKFASSFYGPFRDAAYSSPKFGNRCQYQMDPANADEAIREVELDIKEGADIVMVKPALPYLDILRRVKDRFKMPTAAYNVSGEYSAIMAAVERGFLDEEKVILETLLSIKRAGADIIITYFAKDYWEVLG
ncbi:MAG: porphobilinogen synthase [Candidatus Methanofastidiosia archaeon]